MEKKIVIGFFISFVLIHSASFHHLYAQEKESPVLKESQRLYEKKEFVKALDLLEKEMEKGEVPYNFYLGFFSTEEFMELLYQKANQIDRGAKFLYHVYTTQKEALEKKEQSHSISRHLEEALFNLSLQNRSFDIALEIAQDDFLEREISFAQIYAAQGKKELALQNIKNYLNSRSLLSCNQIMVKREFRSLYGDPEFREIMTDTTERFYARMRGFDIEDKGKLKPPLSFASVQKAAQVYKNVINPASIKKMEHKLENADQKILSSIHFYKDKILSLLKNEKKSIYYRLSLGLLLTSLGDPLICQQVVVELSQDNFLQYPQQLFWLAYQVVKTDPVAARPLLMQMLKRTGGEAFIPQHALRIDWDELLFQAFGVAEIQYKSDLLAIAESGSPTESRNAINVLAAFQEPKLADVLKSKILKEEDSEKRKTLIKKMADLVLPQSRAALSLLRKELPGKYGDDPAEIDQLAAQIKPPDIEYIRGKPAAVAIEDDAIKDIFFNNMECTFGIDTSFLMDTILLSVKKNDIDRLCRIRGKICYRLSDEGFSDYQIISDIISYLRWQDN